jgi:hypothetical protein
VGKIASGWSAIAISRRAILPTLRSLTEEMVDALVKQGRWMEIDYEGYRKKV